MNSVVLIGRLCADPEIRYTTGPEPKAVAKFTLAVNRQFKDKGADFLRIVVFGKTAENCERFLAKGRLVGIQGRIQTGSYKSQTGETRYTTDIVADRVEFLEWGEKGGAGKTGDGYDIPEGFEALTDDDMPF